MPRRLVKVPGSSGSCSRLPLRVFEVSYSKPISNLKGGIFLAASPLASRSGSAAKAPRAQQSQLPATPSVKVLFTFVLVIITVKKNGKPQLSAVTNIKDLQCSFPHIVFFMADQLQAHENKKTQGRPPKCFPGFHSVFVGYWRVHSIGTLCKVGDPTRKFTAEILGLLENAMSSLNIQSWFSNQ